MNWENLKRVIIYLWVFTVTLILFGGVFYKPATDTGEREDVAVEETQYTDNGIPVVSGMEFKDKEMTIAVKWEIHNNEFVGYTYKDSCGYHWWDHDGKRHSVKYKSIIHTDTPEPVCPWCGEKDNYGLLWTSNKSGNMWIEIGYRCNSCNKDFTMTVTEEHLKHYTTEGVTQ